MEHNRIINLDSFHDNQFISSNAMCVPVDVIIIHMSKIQFILI